MSTQANPFLHYFINLQPSTRLPRGIQWLNPYSANEVTSVCKEFFDKYYAANDQRIALLGINPGRLGSGTTGIGFTDPVALHEACGIDNPFEKRAELSSTFIYQVVEAFGGTEKFFGKFVISAVCPLGFVRGGKNINYYDTPALHRKVTPFIEQTLTELSQLPVSRRICVCIGEGPNYTFLSMLNGRHRWFDQVITLPHPRFIMQYRRKQLAEYIERYVSVLGSIG